MIKPEDIRAGNYIQGPPFSIPKFGWHSDGVVQITSHGLTELIRIPFRQENYSPLILTDEWLRKLGFNQDCDGFYLLEIGRKAFRISTNEGNHVVYKHNIGQKWAPVSDGIEYVHQLQNLCYILTGEELQIKDNESTQ